MQYFGEPEGRVKIQMMSKNLQRYYTLKCLIRYIYFYETMKYFGRRGEVVAYQRGGRSLMRGGCNRRIDCIYIFLIYALKLIYTEHFPFLAVV